ncbi:MAG TPA: amino acid adenylation domain-containing protein [Thermoanaerobaculia bacterium]|jgi:amino acid adenylation domain-containing protein|nr:amino acid adenylation domain-containing protein [Thermoanaerobaculia bacterium]
MKDWNDGPPDGDDGLDHGLDIAIIAMAGRFPGAPDVERFWENLRAGVESIRAYSDEELIALGADPALVRDPAYVKVAAWLPDIDFFDAGFFGFSPREAEILDPQQRLFLECAWGVLEKAGYDSERYPGLIGVYAGSGTNEYLLFHLMRGITDLHNVLQLTIGNEKDFLATRISYELDLRGPSINVQTGCSSSLVGVHLACQSLLAYQCDMALAGGISLQVHDGIPGYLYQPGGVLSPDGHCRAFSAGAQGAVAGSGVGIVVLKRLADALADGDTVHAVIKGSALNNDGAAKIGYTAPSIEGQSRVIDMAQAAAAVDPRSISYVEAHGSGTPLGDPIEVTALTRAFRAGTRDRGFCALGSVKTNVGHLDTAAGMAGLIKTALALSHRQIPPSLHFDRPNPQIDFAESPFYVNTRLTDWPAGETPRRAGVSSFGIGGTNAHLILEEAPALPPSSPPRPWDLLLLSARSATALEQATDNLAAHLDSHAEENLSENLSDIAWTLQTGRRRFLHRRALVVPGGATRKTSEETAKALRERDPQRLLGSVEEAGDRSVAFLFPGVGDHYPGMAAGLYRNEPVFRREMDAAAEILRPLLGLDLREVLFTGETGTANRADAGVDLRSMLGRGGSQAIPAGSPLLRTSIAQPAVFAVEVALARLWMSRGVRPAALLGYSLGEYAAACIAGVFSLEDGLRVVAERARLIEGLPAGAMLAVPLPAEEVAAGLAPRLSIAALNGPGLTVVAGPPEEVEALARELGGRGVVSRALPTTHAFHSWMMEPIAGAVGELLASVRLVAPAIPFISDVTGTWITAAEATDPAYWVSHLLRPVRFGEGVAELGKDPARVFLEVGPGQSLGSLATQHPSTGSGRIVAASLRHAYEHQPDGAFLTAALARLWLAGCRIDWAGFHDGARRRRVPLPTYPFERQRYWISGSAAAPAEAAGANRSEAEAPRHGRPSSLRNAFVPPGTELERAVAGLWERLLGIAGIGLHDNFFELGGHSLLGTHLVNMAREALGVDVPLNALFETPTVAGMTAAVAAGRAAGGGAGQVPPLVSISREELGEQGLPLSFSQSRMWFLHRLEPASPAYNIPFALRLQGEAVPQALLAAVRGVVRRHEALRTTFPDAPGAPGTAAQVIAPAAAADRFAVPVIDLSGLPEAPRQRELELLAGLSARAPFDLATGPLLRVTLVRLAAEEHALLLNMHHIVSDGWSVGVFLGEMSALYEDSRLGRPPALPSLPLQYADFAAWQSRWLQGEVLERHLGYWKSKLAGRPAVLELPVDHPRRDMGSSAAGEVSRVLPAAVAVPLRSLAEREAVTPFIALLSLFDVVLGRWCRQDDVVVGTPIANRTRAEISGLIGFFVNTLVLRSDLAGDPTFRALLGRVGETALGAFAHQDLPFEKLVEEIHPERALAVTPLFQVLFAYQNAPLPRIELPRLTLAGLESGTKAAMFDLTLTVGEIGAGPEAGGFAMSLEFARNLFDATTAERLLGHVVRLAAAAVESPDRHLSALPMLAPEERFQLVTEWSDTARPISIPISGTGWAHDLVAAQAALRPEALAVSAGESLSYGDLEARAGRLASHLRDLGVGPEVPVALLLDRSAALVVGAYGVLKAGGAYLPLDPASPPERLATILAESGASLVLTCEALRGKLPDLPGTVQALALDTLDLSGQLPLAAPPRLHAESPAYLIYTSGSTGVPKGVEVTHGALLNLLAWHREAFAPGPGERGTLVASPGFDVSVLEIWPLLAAGGSVHAPDDATRLSPPALLKWLARERITLGFLPTPLAEAVLREGLPDGLALRVLMTAGDKLLQSPRQPLPFVFHNLYGPAECTVISSGIIVPAVAAGGEAPPIGRPISNYAIHLLDPVLNPVPIGVSGELFIGGAGLARGYRRRADLTAERFLPSPFVPGERLYRTGDLARFRADGVLDFLGRLDHQVKVRGFRIELGEVETAIAGLPGVVACAAAARAQPSGDVRLVAYVVAALGTAGTELRRALRARLPEYMIPAAFVMLDALPMTANGKVDRQALPEPSARDAGEHVPPRTPIEEELARIWSELLGLPLARVGVNDNFFDLGGHSLLATQCISRVRDSLGVDLALQILFGAATLGDLADTIVETELAQTDSEALQQMLNEMTLDETDGLDLDELRALLAGGDGGDGGGEG